MKLFRDLLRDYRFAIAFWVLCLLIAFAALSLFSPYDPTRWGQAPRDLRPSAEHWLGTDSNGQDVFWNATFAVRNSLIIAVIAGVVSRIIAVAIGMVAGYRGGMWDRTLMFVSDSLLVIPLFLIIVMMAMLIRASLNLATLGLLLAFFGWAWDARLIRSQMLSLRERDFTQTAILSGTGTLKLVINEYMPYTTPLIFSTLINNMAWAIGLEITLAILGLLDMSIPTLGTMLYWAINYQAILLGRWWWVTTPILLSVLLFIALYWLSVSISEYLDPRTRVQRVGA
ncbi:MULTISPECIES: ABC transporter permease [Roseiflexus]|uniref:Binding-protein-dependent transport systems inner membrane component n=1 Tax=Roseiflexus castenholzii (strain DSM 13941 / HLO8) TaxID=383372 RepID=A7NHS2_ROSCS|nr:MULTISPECIES: ABC transporter permease [Roseiflexus]ABU57019.1 binding-protein-dependent transport systems inner membrane component [Roseiflexus castenholzii DSM 13941]PMP76920.1 MAG: ABC transporter permease [Roseiflexus castenholzii]GIV99830.1 MAG: peptide ABC transporter permease [Roseiflexus sp.]